MIGVTRESGVKAGCERHERAGGCGGAVGQALAGAAAEAEAELQPRAVHGDVPELWPSGV